MGKIDGGLRALLHTHVPSFHWQAIESGMTGGGIPDSNYCAPRGAEGWVECKWTPGWTVPLEPAQVGWISRRVRNGGRVFIAIRQMAPAGPRTAARDALWLVPGRLAREARVGGLRALHTDGAAPPVLVWHGGPARWDWDAVAALLAS